jgi:hypothetical protein
MSSAESLAVQRLALHRYPDSLRCLSNFHAGPGQQTFGFSPRHRTDATLLFEGGRVVFYNYDSNLYHTTKAGGGGGGGGRDDGGGHASWCKKFNGSNPLRPNDATTRRNAYNAGLARALTGVSLSLRREPGDGERVDSRIRATQPQEDREEKLAAPASEGSESSSSDALIRFSRVEYVTEVDCHLFCGNEVGDGHVSVERLLTRLNEKAAAEAAAANEEKDEDDDDEDDLREGGPQPAVLAPPERVLDRDRLLETLLSDDPAVWKRYAGSFVSIRGGRETVRDAFAANTGLCFQKAACRDGTGAELGPYARKVCARTLGFAPPERGGMAGMTRQQAEETDAYLKKRASVPLTLARRSFPPDGSVHTMSVEYFRFLCKARGLEGYELVHLIYYARRFWNRSFMWNDVLLCRHRLCRDGKRDSLEAETCKLFGNAVYGFYGVRKTTQTTARLVGEHRLLRKEQRRAFFEASGGRIMSCVLVGGRLRYFRAPRPRRPRRHESSSSSSPPPRKRARFSDKDDDDDDDDDDESESNTCDETRRPSSSRSTSPHREASPSLSITSSLLCSDREKDNSDDQDDDAWETVEEEEDDDDDDDDDDREQEQTPPQPAPPAAPLTERAQAARASLDNWRAEALVGGRGGGGVSRLVEPELVYLVTRRPSSKTKDINLMHAFTYVLSQSKVLFLDKLVRLVNHLDPAMAQPAYYDTDGALFLLRHPSIVANVVPSRREAFLRREAPTIFADETSPLPQAALLKPEGLYKGAQIKATKAYRCVAFDEEADRAELAELAACPDALKPTVRRDSKKLKGCARHQINKLGDEAFSTEAGACLYVASTGLRPTTGLEMNILRATRRLPIALNNKRYTPRNGIGSFPLL